ncbi:type IV pilus secretin PilQ [Geobacter pickeringii]|uniref:Pilus assembly protein PilQ n=1 Tax=Geobacter pickeringii TaxID=345632 RepID=A0A0B5B8C0_9BACT|nr:type IV pilus secretin PilQ [Geobacter pickeringii]AJE02903.1 pilus assembly protein PilQ [Geobacter pickeringii]
MRIDMNISRSIASIAVIVALCGCAGANSSSKGGTLVEQTRTSALQDVRISGEGKSTQVVVTADRPIAYTFYMTDNPPRAIVDLAQVEPGTLPFPMEVNKGAVRKIEAIRHGDGGSVMTRLELQLAKGAEVTATPDPRDKSVLVLAVTAPEVAPMPPVAEAKPAGQNAAPAAAEAKAAAVTVAADVAPAAAATPPTDGGSKPAMSPSEGSTITAISADDSSLEIHVAGGVIDYKSFRLAKPDRLVVDVLGAKSGIASKILPLNRLGVGTARIGAYPDKVRVVFDSARGPLQQLTVEKSGSGLKIVPAGARTGQAPPSVAEEAVAPSKPAQEEAAPSVAKQPEIKHAAMRESSAVESIDFKVDDGVSRLLVSVSGGCDAEKPAKTADGLAVTLKNCTLPTKWQRFLDTSAFASTVVRVTPYQVKTKGRSDVKIQLKMRQSAPFELSRSGKQITLALKNPADLESPMVAKELAGSDKSRTAETTQKDAAGDGSVITITPKGESAKKVYTGRRITLEFSDADIRKIFQLIAEVSNLNFLVGDDVTGTISIKLVNVPWDQALDVILENKGLGMQRDGNIVQIRPKSKIQTLADEEQAMKKAKEKAMELKTEVFDINFANVADVVTQFNALKSDRGTITQDVRTNRVIVKDIAPSVEDMKFLLKNLDLPERQVMIEARIVEASSDFTRDIGVQWGLHTDKSAGSTNVLGISNADSGFGGILSGTAASTGTFGPGLATGITFGKIISGGTLDLKLSAAATTGQVKIISTPKVVTLNNKAAKISQGQSIPYQTTSAEGTKTEFVEAALTLEVTPHISADGSVAMKIKASNNSAGTGSPPPINKKEATTELLVKNGETTVIGGIYVDSDTDSDQGVPFLKDIPLLGHLFKSSTKTKNKTELLIFITPKVIS